MAGNIDFFAFDLRSAGHFVGMCVSLGSTKNVGGLFPESLLLQKFLSKNMKKAFFQNTNLIFHPFPVLGSEKF